MNSSSTTEHSVQHDRPRDSTYLPGQTQSGPPLPYNHSRSNRTNSLSLSPDSDLNIGPLSREQVAENASNSSNGLVKSSSLTDQIYSHPVAGKASSTSSDSISNKRELSGGRADRDESSAARARRCKSDLPSLNSNTSSQENGNGHSPSPASSSILNPFLDSFEAANEESKQPLPHDHIRLGLNEDFFKPDQNETLGSTSVEELESAIATLRERIIHEPEQSARREHLVRTIVNLRKRLLELKEERGNAAGTTIDSSFSPESSSRLPTPVYTSSIESNSGVVGSGIGAASSARPNSTMAIATAMAMAAGTGTTTSTGSPTAAKQAMHVRRVQGHRFVRATTAIIDLKRSSPKLVENELELGGLSQSAMKLMGHSASKKLCDCCTRHIWNFLQETFVCVDCRFRVHSKCLNLVTRNCLSQWMKDSPQYEMTICPEKGLLAQGFRCADCKAAIFSQRCAADKSGARPSRDRTGDALSGFDCFESSSSEHSADEHLPATSTGTATATAAASGRSSRSRTSAPAAAPVAAGGSGAAGGNNNNINESDAQRELETSRSPDSSPSRTPSNSLALEDAKPARLCDYCGLYYCARCHWNDQLVVPARLIRNWDFTPRPVCRTCRQRIRLLQTRATLDLDLLNPAIYESVTQIAAIRHQRTRLLLMKKYFEVCPRALENRLLLEVGHRTHFVESPSLYSLVDLIDTHTGALATELDRILGLFSSHIKLKCPLCQAKAFTCELCRTDELLWPFDEGAERTVAQCARCQTCFHRVCYSRYVAQQKQKQQLLESESSTERAADGHKALSNGDGAILSPSAYAYTYTACPNSPAAISESRERFDCPRCERLERRRLARKSDIETS